LHRKLIHGKVVSIATNALCGRAGPVWPDHW